MRKKRKVSKRDPLPKRKPAVVEEEEDLELDEDDLEFLAEYGNSAGFLRNLSQKELEKPLPKKLPVPRNQGAGDSDSLGSLTDSEGDADDAEGQAEDEDSLDDDSADKNADGNGSDASMSDGEEEEDEVVESNGKVKANGLGQKVSAVSAPRLESSAPSLPPTQKRKRAAPVSEDAELDVEKLPRAGFKPKAGSNRLPIKLADGSVAFQLQAAGEDEAKESEQEEDSEGSDEEEQSEVDDISEGASSVADDQPANGGPDPGATFASQKEELARVASGLLEDPQGRISALKTLHKRTFGPDGRLKRLGMLTQLAIFTDIIPGYRIRPRTEAEKQMKVSQEVKKLNNFEDALVDSYKTYIQHLEKTANGEHKVELRVLRTERR
jgi:nucleolar complex protein 3